MMLLLVTASNFDSSAMAAATDGKADPTPGVFNIDIVATPIFADGFEGLSEGSVCTVDTDCATGLLCCYPCGIPGCENLCTIPVEEMCLAVP